MVGTIILQLVTNLDQLQLKNALCEGRHPANIEASLGCSTYQLVQSKREHQNDTTRP